MAISISELPDQEEATIVIDPPETTASVTADSANFEIDNVRNCKINCHYPCMYSYRYQVMIMEIFR